MGDTQEDMGTIAKRLIQEELDITTLRMIAKRIVYDAASRDGTAVQTLMTILLDKPVSEGDRPSD